MKKDFAFALLSALILLFSACAPTETPPPSPTPTRAPATPVPQPYAPQPEDSSLKRASVFLESIDLLPVIGAPEVRLHLSGNLPTPCHALRVEISPPDAANAIAVSVYSVVDPDLMCEDVLRRFDVTVSLGEYPPGRYTVFVNGARVGDFLR